MTIFVNGDKIKLYKPSNTKKKGSKDMKTREAKKTTEAATKDKNVATEKEMTGAEIFRKLLLGI